MLKPFLIRAPQCLLIQPPLGGCVLKLIAACFVLIVGAPAAFRRLCVETATFGLIARFAEPAAFRRLCVETACTKSWRNWL